MITLGGSDSGVAPEIRMGLATGKLLVPGKMLERCLTLTAPNMLVVTLHG